MKNINLLLLLFISIQALASNDVYMQKDSQGGVIFSDVPLNNNAQIIENVDSTASSSPALTSALPPPNLNNYHHPNGGMSSLTGPAQSIPYTSFDIASPKNQESIQNQPVFKVSVTVQPALQKGDAVQIYLDGQPMGAPMESTNFAFPAPDRGTHQLSAILIDAQGNIAKQAGPITVYVHQAHVGGPALGASS